jgi:hypothetical protein
VFRARHARDQPADAASISAAATSAPRRLQAPVSRAHAQRRPLTHSLRMGPRPTRRQPAIKSLSSPGTLEHRGSDGNAPAASRGDKVTISWTCGGRATPLRRQVPTWNQELGDSCHSKADRLPGRANRRILAIRQFGWIIRRSNAGRHDLALSNKAARRWSALTLGCEIGKDFLDPVQPWLACRHARQ